MLKATRSLITNNKLELFAVASISLFVIGVMAHGIIRRNSTNNQLQSQTKNQGQSSSENQGEVAGVAITSEPTPTPTIKPYKPITYPTNTPIPLSTNQPQTTNNSPTSFPMQQSAPIVQVGIDEFNARYDSCPQYYFDCSSQCNQELSSKLNERDSIVERLAGMDPMEVSKIWEQHREAAIKQESSCQKSCCDTWKGAGYKGCTNYCSN